MFSSCKINSVLAVFMVILNSIIVQGLFELENRRIDLQSNARFPLASLRHRRGESTRVAFVGQRGDRLSLVCNINFSTDCRRPSFFHTIKTRRGRCCDDYFYVGFNLDPDIRGAEYFCGQKTIRKNSRNTSGRPVLVVGKFMPYNCYNSGEK